MPPVELLDPLEPVVELSELVGAAKGGDLLLPQPVLVVVDLSQRRCALVKPKNNILRRQKVTCFSLKNGILRVVCQFTFKASLAKRLTQTYL